MGPEQGERSLSTRYLLLQPMTQQALDEGAADGRLEGSIGLSLAKRAWASSVSLQISPTRRCDTDYSRF